MLAEFSGVDTSNPNCVVIGDAAEYFQYDSLNECFRKLMDMEKPILFTLGIGYCFLCIFFLLLSVLISFAI